MEGAARRDAVECISLSVLVSVFARDADGRGAGHRHGRGGRSPPPAGHGRSVAITRRTVVAVALLHHGRRAFFELFDAMVMKRRTSSLMRI
jgi:hypothetical protein